MALPVISDGGATSVATRDGDEGSSSLVMRRYLRP
jgi:hypothetical protein